ncbi:GIY-YIG nuclease family protein [Flintibacter muris]|uniref:GIY-YIG nuclease family protein n=1 Tax=Flintibacter muris TaxID=2941327 RepID=UPI00203B124C|nr:GIY-YIG nuclease family protein [Flintibacter muris]
MFIYKITNKLDGKIYVGQTIRPVHERFKRHINDALNNIIDTHFARAIRKYGERNFVIEIIDTANTQEELTQKEHFWIGYYNSTNPEIGYNETNAVHKCGGNTYQAKSPSELSAISEKIRLSKIGNKNSNARKIKCLNVVTRQELFFETVKECKEHFKETNHRFITVRTSHKVIGLYKNQWMIAYADECYGDYLKERHKSGTTIQTINKSTCDMRIFDSIRLAARELKISRSNIMAQIRKGKTQFVINNYEFTILN